MFVRKLCSINEGSIHMFWVNFPCLFLCIPQTPTFYVKTRFIFDSPHCEIFLEQNLGGVVAWRINVNLA